jgi:tRNA-5-taurinomethyluridine 2-sulfurtransferase
LLLNSSNGKTDRQANVTARIGVETRLHRETQRPTVALLLSGGVDSSVALNLLKRQDYDVTAFYLKIWLEDELAHMGQCPWEDDYRTCQEVCEQAGVSLEAISLQQEYKERVISYIVREAEQGRTPNPDIMCNSRIKFGCFYDAIATRNFDFVATGHYAQLSRHENRMRLVRAPDPVKDQSYFLCALTQEQLQRVLFPIGHLQKSEVRALAEAFELPNRHRPDSQGLCFLGKVKFDKFLATYLGERPGKIIDAATGDIIGQHKGVWFHTIGQRKGIGKGLDPLATSRGPWYVVAKDPVHDIVFCSNQYDEDLFAAARSEFFVESIQWIAGVPPKLVRRADDRLTMKIRHGPRIVGGSLSLTDGAGLLGEVKLDHKDGGLAPGQYVAFYDDEECLGGGVISERHWANFLRDRQEASSSGAVTAA